MRVYWKAAITGNFEDPANWSDGVVPGAADRVSLLGSTPYSVTISSEQSVLTLETSATTTLNIEGFHGGNDVIFSIIAGTGAGANAGTINLLGAGGEPFFNLAGKFQNTGSMNLENGAAIQIASFLTLTGGGHLNLDGFVHVGGTLTNVDNIIAGSGEVDFPFGINSTIINAALGIIDATSTDTALLFDQGGNITNAGTIEATGGANGGLSISDPVTNSGLLLATNGSGVGIINAT